MTATKTESVDKLNSLLQGELSAVETYRQALEKVKEPGIKETLKTCHQCHSGRVDTLVEEIVKMGGNRLKTLALGVRSRS